MMESRISAIKTKEKKQTNQEGNRLNLLAIIKVLSTDSSKEKPMSATEIKKRLDDVGLVLDSHTITRTLQGATLSLEASTRLSQFLNLNIHIVDAEGNDLIDYEESRKIKRYYFIENALKPAEIKMLTDAVEVYNYITQDETIAILQKLNELQIPEMRSKYHHLGRNSRAPKIDSLPMSKELEGSFFLIVDTLEQAIRDKRKVSLLYGTHNTRKELVPLPKYPKVISPYQIMWANGYYYLVALIKNKPFSFRIDRILEVTEHLNDSGEFEVCDPLPEALKKEIVVGHDTFSPQLYQNTAVIMYSGIPERITIECKDSMVNTLLDSFGLDINIQRSIRRDGWITVRFCAATSGVALWLTQYCESSYAVSPKHLVEKVKENLKNGMKNYNYC